MTKRCLQFVSVAIVLAFSLVKPEVAAAQATPPPAGQRAGSITALLPTAKITRGAGKNRAILEAKKGDTVVFNDLLQTEKGGRARITLNDQSILSLGSQAELRIIKHDARTQQTALQLGYGRVRAEVASVTRDGGRFELRTPTAVAGVIGTDFGTDSSLPGVTSFICITGIVQVSNSDANIAGTVPCPAGSTTTVNTGLPPTAPKPATQQQIQQLIQDTEPAIISSLSPASVLLGTEVITAASGSKMAGINGVSISGSGISVALEGTPTDSNANVKVVVDANATPGTRTLTFSKANGQTSAAVFTIMSPPTKGQGGTELEVLKKTYLEILEQERQSAITGVNALGIGVQQSAADTQQAIQNDNLKLQPPLDTAPIDKDIQNDVAPMIAGMAAAGESINLDAANAAKQIEAAFADAQKRIAAANPAPSEDEKLKLAKEIFDGVNSPLMRRFTGIQDTLGAVAKAVNARLLRTVATWMENLKIEAAKQKAVPLPRVDADERSYDLGSMASFDAARSTPTPGGSISNFNWVLCDPSYKPQQIGVPLPPADTRCRPLAGFTSASSDFKFPTCQLNPQDYIARVTVTDTNNKATAMDVRVRVLPPQYDPPGLRLRSLSDSYQQLQLNNFLGFFDESYSGLTELQESIRRTFLSLASMNINLRLSQAAVGCNEATVRADWEQAYTFKDDQTCANLTAGAVCQRVVFKQQEQLTVRMKRIPGKNWYITEFQGDNGTVQGTPPGPIQRDISLPDLHISSLTPSALPSAGPAAGREGSVIGVAPGANGFAAVIENVGAADLLTSVKVRFVARDTNGNEIATDLRDLPGPIPVGGSVTVVGELNVPDLAPGVGARIFAVVNPGCVVPEQNCDGTNAALLDIVVGVVDLQVNGFNAASPIIATQPTQVDVQVKNVGSRTSFGTAGNLKLFFGSNLIAGGSIPPIAPGATVTVPLTFTAPNISGTPVTLIAIAPASPGDTNTANDSLTGSLTVLAATVDLRTTGLAITSTAPFLSGQTLAVTMNVQNAGNRPSALTDSLACILTSTAAGTQSFTPVPLAPIPAGGTATGLTFSFVIPVNFGGTNSLTCGVSADPFEATALAADNKTTIPITISRNVDLQIVNVPPVTGADQMGGTSSVTFGVQNFGLDTAPAGWNVVLQLNSSPVANFVASSPLAGLATTPVSLSYVNPQVAPAPADVNVTASLQVNANAAIAETNTANNTFSTTLRLVDFTLAAATAGGNAVVGRPVNISPAVTVLPNTYPLPLTLNYANLPPGVVGSGSPFAQDLTGTPTSTGGFTIATNATVDAVTRTRTGLLAVNVLPEISLSLGTAFGSLQSGGSSQPLQVNVTGGIYPVTVALSGLPAGVTAASPLSATLTGPGSVTWNISAAVGSATGAFVITVQGTDGGVAATGTPSGNVSLGVAATVNGQANYVISSIALGTPHTTGTGADALQVGESAPLNFVIQNTGNLTQAGTISLNVSSGCGSPLTSSVSAPAAGATVTATLNQSASCSPGSYSWTGAITAAPPESTTADNTLGPIAFEVFDFSLTNPTPLAPQNVLLSGSGSFTVSLTETGPPSPLALPLVVTNGGKAATTPTSISISPGNTSVLVSAAAGTVSGDSEVITAAITRFGVTKSATQAIQFYTASVDNISSGQPGSTISNPILLPLDSTGTFVDFKLVGTFAGAAT
ncbi:MAG TPA: FecR domain-containing protein, partial [Terriglobales bacterium]|nr:FecR domain-containing protein [Terriglobales bacterium]